MSTTFTNYDRASAFLGSKPQRTLPGICSTIVHRLTETSVALKYHATDVITYHADGRFVFNSGGWRTLTTKSRITEFSPVRLWSDKGIWMTDSGPFAEGCEWKAGQWTGLSEDERARQLHLRRKIALYVAGFGVAIKNGEIKRPSNGDCWGCLFNTAEGKPETFPMLGVDHLLGHFGGTEEEPEPYYVPSLLMRALKWRGYQNPEVIWVMMVEGKQPETPCRALRAFLIRMLEAGASRASGGGR